MNLQNKKVLVTGSAGGIGSTIVTELTKESAVVLKHVSKNANRENTYTADFSNLETISSMFEKIKQEHQTIDCVINTVGIEEAADDQLETAHWQRLFTVNLFAAAELSREAIKAMQNGGVIVHISSIMGNQGIVGESSLAYSLTKTALQKLSANLALMYASKGIRVFSLSPGYTETPIWDTFDEQLKKQAIQNVPINRFIKPEEVADFIIAAVKNNAVTGVNLDITGGLNLKSII